MDRIITTCAHGISLKETCSHCEVAAFWASERAEWATLTLQLAKTVLGQVIDEWDKAFAQTAIDKAEKALGDDTND